MKPMVTFFFSIILLPLLAQQAGTQNTPGTARPWELGLNATYFIKTFLSFNENNAIPQDYLFSLKKLNEQQKGLRLGVNLNFSNDRENLINNGKRTNDFAALSLRCGKEWQIPVYHRWYVLTGYDFLGSISHFRSKTDTESDLVKVRNTTYRLGAGPFLGVQFRLNERIGLFTEANLYLVHNRRVEKITLESFPDQNKNNKSSSNGLWLNMPSSIFFYMKF